jgi:hypothetical protein
MRVSEIPPYVFSGAVRRFWRTLDQQAAKQKHRGTAADHGRRAAVTGGAQMDGFCSQITKLLTESGVRPASVYTKRRTTDLPGFFRATKDWDLVVVEEGRLIAVVELKSQVGPSFGNNLNNRTEEALGSSECFWTAYREGAFGTSPQPWLGFLLLLEHCPESIRPVSVREPHFEVLPEFKGTSYARRYEILCRKLVRERKYNAACFLMSTRGSVRGEQNYIEPAEDLSARVFLEDLLAHAAPVR